MKKKYKILRGFDYINTRENAWRHIPAGSEFIVINIIKEPKCNCGLKAIIEPHDKFPGIIGFDLGFIIKMPNRFK